jgi:CHRD domain-containing protein
MKSLKQVSIFASVLSFALFTSALTQNGYSQLNRYWVALNTDQDEPPVITDAKGFVGFKFSDSFNRLIYTVNVHNIDNVTGVYLYLKNDTQGNAPILDLLKKHKESNRENERWSDVTKDGQLTGTINLSGVTKKHLIGAVKGESMKDVSKLMAEDQLYIVVYTKDYPNGELRGDSFIGMDDVFHNADEFKW